MRGWLREHTLAASTLLGLLFYAAALLTYSNFYGEFGVEPEEAGVNYTTTLARAFPAFFAWLVGWLVFLLAAALGIALRLFAVALILGGPLYLVDKRILSGRVWRKVLSARNSLGSDRANSPSTKDAASGVPVDSTPRIPILGKRPAKRGRVISTMVVLIIFLIAFAVLGFFVNAAATSENLAERVREGDKVTPVSLFEEMSFQDVFVDAFIPWADPIDVWSFHFVSNPLRLRVEHVRVFPAESSRLLPADIEPGSTWALLGQTGDTVVLHDISNDREETLRIPANLVALLRDTERGRA